MRLAIDDSVVIDKMFSSKATWTTAPLQLEKGDFIDIKLDYASYESETPMIEMWWDRPTGPGATYKDEVIPSNYFSRTDGFALKIAEGETSTGLQ